ncbi:MAG TPA: response regulator [Vicinamibacterales bacterium]|jgi:PAS domain S-box-containing protein
MPQPDTTITIALATRDQDSAVLTAALLSQVNGGSFCLRRVPTDETAAVEQFRSAAHDVCLIDLRMLDRDGLLLSAALGRGRPVMILTEHEDASRDERLIRAGVWDCLVTANLTSTALVRSVRRAIEHNRQTRTVTHTEDALRRAESRFRSLVGASAYGICRTTIDGLIVEANLALAVMLGLESDAGLVGQNILPYYQDATDRERLLVAYRAGGRVAPIELQWRRADDTPIWVRLSGRAVQSEDGVLVGLEMLVEDVTEHRQLENQFRQSQKMEAVGRLAGGVAHDFNNLLTAMLGYAEMLRDRLPEDDACRHDIEEIRKAAERGSALTRQLLTFSRKQTHERRTIDLNAVVSGFDKMLRRLIGEDIELRTLPDAQQASVRADPGQVEQVIMNLAVNARDAMPEGGCLTIETANIDLDASYARTHAEVVPGPYVMLAVSDTGCGMTPEVLSHVFEPFFTTKAHEKGSGLGLATVYGIVKQSGGHIWVYSEPDKGSAFKIYLPRVNHSAAATVPSVAVQPACGSETILLVEDEPSVRCLSRDVLARHGYQVLVANHGREALAVAQAFNGEIDLLLTDVVMPGMNGRELVRHMLWMRPHIPVLYMSGYTDHTVMAPSILEPNTAFLQKPFTPDILVTTVRRILDNKLVAAKSANN